ncbi:MAG: PAS domain-containing protein [Caldimonas sp.]
MSDTTTARASSAAAEGWLRAFVEQSPDLLVATDTRGTILWSNANAAALAAAPGASLVGLVAADGEGAATRRSLEAALAAGSLEPAALVLTDAAGDARHIVARMQRCDDALIWTLTDVSAAHRLADEARRQHELLDMAQEFGRIGVWERELPSGEGHWDRHVFGFWGLDPANGTPTFEQAIEHIHPDDRAVMSYLDTTQQVGRHKQRYRVIHADGRTRWIHSQWEIVSGPDGTPNRVIGLMMDDTEVYEGARALGDASAQLKLAADLGNIVTWRHDLRNERMYYSDRGFEILQMPPRPEGMPLDEARAIIHPDDIAQVTATAAETLATGQPTDTQARYRRSDGTYRDVILRRVVERDAAGEPIAFVGVALDISEHVQNRREADRLAHRLEAASRAAGIGLWTASLDPPEVEWNAQMFALFDRFTGPQVPTFGDWLRACVHPDDRSRIARRASSYLVSGEGPAEFELRILRRDGGMRWIVLRADHDRAVTDRRRILGVAMDVTEYHQALSALHDASERAALITHHAGIGMWEGGEDGSPERWDEQMFRLRGLAPGPVVPSREERLAIVHPDDVGRLVDVIAPREIGDEATSYEFRVRLPDGSWRWLASRSAMMRDDAGRLLRRVGVNWDITESKNAELTRQQTAIAEREIQAKSHFLSRMSHELRTPLNAVLGFTQLLQIEARQSAQPSQLAMLGHVRAAGDHLLSLINDVLDLSGLEAGDLRLALQPVDLAQMAQQSVPLVESLAAQHGVMVEVDAASGAVANADPTRLRQVLINLLSNAIKYNRAHGRVFVRTGVERGSAVLSVRDTGRGLGADQVARLFEPFNRFGAENEGIEGTGIGLTIVKALVEGMGGSIHVASQPGTGTTFEVRLPVSERVPAPPPTVLHGPDDTRPGELPHARSGQILYIEDNPVNVLLVEELVKSVSGLRIVSEATGASGTARAIALKPDLVLIDLQLPDFDGYEVLRRLRADPETRDIPCIALSANAMPDDVQRGLAAGFSDYWTKPIAFANFLSSLKKIFPGEPIRERA